MPKKDLEALGLREPLDRMKVFAYMLRSRVMPYWTEARGLFFRPHIGKDARERFQQVLHLYGREDVQRLRSELREGFVTKRTGISRAKGKADLREDEIRNQIERKMRARKRSRGPYRKSSSLV